MANVADPLTGKLPTRFGWVRSRYGALAIAIVILALGVLAVLVVQPAPRTFAEGWSSPQAIEQVRLGKLHHAAIDDQDNIHLVWLKQVVRKLVAHYAKLDANGQVLDGPVALSNPDANAEDVALVLTSDAEPLVFWIEKSGEEILQTAILELIASL